MIWFDDVPVIFEGNPRIRWESTRPGHWLSGDGATPDGPQPIVGSLWPDNATRLSVRRRIKQFGPTLVVFDLDLPEIVLPPHRIPRVLDGATVRGRSDGRLTLTIDPLNWLDPINRDRGRAFLESARLSTSWSTDTGEHPIVVERDLITSREPLRFACHKGPLRLDQLRRTKERVFGQWQSHSATSAPASVSSLQSALRRAA